MAENETTSSSGARRIKLQVKNKLGLHLRPASRLVELATRFEDCEISLTKDGQTVNAKSIMGVIMLAAEQGSELILEASGASADEALKKIEQLISGGFGEE